MAHIQKKTSTMSLTISSSSKAISSSSSSIVVQQQRQSSLVQPLCISPQRTQSPSYPRQYSGGGGVAPTFVERLHDISTVKGQLVVLECRIRGTPPLQVLWYRENEQIVDSADIRILRKQATSASVPEELWTLVITEAFPEDSGLFKCIAGNQLGTVSCDAILEVYLDLEEQMANETPMDEQSLDSTRLEPYDFPSLLHDIAGILPPEWPESPVCEIGHPLEEQCPDSELQPPSKSLEEPFSVSEEGIHSSEGQRSPKACRTKKTTPKLFTPSKPSYQNSRYFGGSSMSSSVADLPTFSPSLFAPSAFNYARPRQFIQSQPAFQAPSYNVAQALPQPNGNSSKASPSSPNLSFPISTPASSQLTVFPRDPPPPSSTAQSMSHSCAPMRSTITLTPRAYAGVPAPPEPKPQSSPAAFLCSVLPSHSTPHYKPAPMSIPQPLSPAISPNPLPKPRFDASLHMGQGLSLPTQSLPMSHSLHSLTPPPAFMPQPPFPPPSCVSLPPSYRGTPNILPKPTLKKAPVPRPGSRNTDEDIQGSKDALIQDLEKKLRTKEARRQNSQKLSYEERMARRLLGPDNAASVFENSSDSQPDQPESPEGRNTGGIWGKHHSGTDVNEGSAIQEKCYAPRFIQVPQDLTVEEGRFCRIDFKVGGLPTPDVAWYLDGKAIRPDDYHKMLVCEKGVHSFIIEIVTVHHAGVYECIARNRAGENRFSMKLEVIAQEVLRPPTFVQKMLNSRALEGDTVRLESKVAASPPPKLFWKKDKDMLRIDPTRMSLYQDGTGSQCLLIERLVKSDAGWYTLSAINEAGMSTCNARLDVGTRTNKPAPPTGKHFKVPLLSHLPILTPDPPQHTAPLYESEEL
ncbi:myotilin isoform X2 [Salmo salar]|uniref:Myotilin isoform X2 n=1 Tax=Salmo salar TaxID=8030 RepID=A0A1S3SV40_SALSA|nr:myotilin isoform X2 [Salmo salar]|eukprot:XP_014068204.1 PREDICTED: myotilin-like isoform X2 [Salmo salar]